MWQRLLDLIWVDDKRIMELYAEWSFALGVPVPRTYFATRRSRRSPGGIIRAQFNPLAQQIVVYKIGRSVSVVKHEFIHYLQFLKYDSSAFFQASTRILQLSAHNFSAINGEKSALEKEAYKMQSWSIDRINQWFKSGSNHV